MLPGAPWCREHQVAGSTVLCWQGLNRHLLFLLQRPEVRERDVSRPASLRASLLDCRRLLSFCLSRVILLCTCVLTFSDKDTGQTEPRLTLLTPFYLTCLIQEPLSECSAVLRLWGLGQGLASHGKVLRVRLGRPGLRSPGA